MSKWPQDNHAGQTDCRLRRLASTDPTNKGRDMAQFWQITVIGENTSTISTKQDCSKLVYFENDNANFTATVPLWSNHVQSITKERRKLQSGETHQSSYPKSQQTWNCIHFHNYWTRMQPKKKRREISRWRNLTHYYNETNDLKILIPTQCHRKGLKTIVSLFSTRKIGSFKLNGLACIRRRPEVLNYYTCYYGRRWHKNKKFITSKPKTNNRCTPTMTADWNNRIKTVQENKQNTADFAEYNCSFLIIAKIATLDSRHCRLPLFSQLMTACCKSVLISWRRDEHIRSCSLSSC